MNRYSVVGCSTFRTERTYSATLINICAYMSIPCRNQGFIDGDFVCEIPVWHEKRLSSLLKANGVSFEVERQRGIIPRALKYRKRLGIWIGAVIFLIMMVSAPRYLWHIDIQGNATLSDEEVIDTLRSAGLYLGVYLPDINVDKIESSALASDGRITWISVNMSGSVAYVELRERVDKEIPERKTPYANVISSHDAIVTEIEVYSGSAVVKTDTFVRAGELLISGVIERETIGTHITYASGRVMGRVFEDVRIEIPYEYTVMEETGRRKYALRFHLFDEVLSIGESASPFASSEEAVSVYSISERGKRLPAFLERVVYLEQTPRIRRRLPADAEAEAYAELARVLDAKLADGELISKEIYISHEKDSLVLTCSVCYETEIGRTSEFEAS